jgi:phosphoribosylformylglycinamidine cyclo-ligase
VKSTKDNQSAYSRSGVDIDAADSAKNLIKQQVKSTFSPSVLTDIGLFGALFQVKGYKDPVLVSSTDGVGTKLKIASLMDKNDTVGTDLVNHCVDDILCCGADPLFFLDYIALGKLVPSKVESIVSGLAKACKESGCSLIGGETAEMPGIYHGNDYDLAGFIVGAVEKRNVIDSGKIAPGDIILGLPSSGPHTNGYSLIRKVFNIDDRPSVLKKYYPEFNRTLGEELLEPHRCYYPQLKPHITRIHGLAHITGGGFIGNIPRIIPDGLAAAIDKKAWDVPPVFKLIQNKGKISEDEMYRVFNMGIGMIVICEQKDAMIIKLLESGAYKIGEIRKSKKSEKILFI